MITNIKNITINKAILHIINGNSSFTSSTFLPNDNLDFNNFLKKHISASVRTKYRKAATFRHKNKNDSYKYIMSMFNNDTDFIENSKILSHQLSLLCSSKNVGPYDLILCEYENNDDEKYIAIILLEFTKSFFHQIVEDSNEALIREYTVLASSNSSLKKCAIIPFQSETISYDLLVNDKSNTEFFINDFLDSELYMDDRKSTETFIEQTIAWVNEKNSQDNIPPNIKEKLEEVKCECISTISRSESIDIEAFENNLFRDELEEFKEDYNFNLENSGLLNKEICLTPEVTADYKVQKIRLDNNVELKLPIDFVNNEDYNYRRDISEDGNTIFTFSGRVVSEVVRSR